jgi:hypothetical protein
MLATIWIKASNKNICMPLERNYESRPRRTFRGLYEQGRFKVFLQVLDQKLDDDTQKVFINSSNLCTLFGPSQRGDGVWWSAAIGRRPCDVARTIGSIMMWYQCGEARNVGEFTTTSAWSRCAIVTATSLKAITATATTNGQQQQQQSGEGDHHQLNWRKVFELSPFVGTWWLAVAVRPRRRWIWRRTSHERPYSQLVVAIESFGTNGTRRLLGTGECF